MTRSARVSANVRPLEMQETQERWLVMCSPQAGFRVFQEIGQDFQSANELAFRLEEEEMAMTRFASVILALSLWFGVGLSAQQPSQSSLRASLEREVASTLVAHDPSWNGSTGFNTPAAQIARSDDWDTVRRLKDGTRVLVTTLQGRDINGRLTTVSEDTLQMVVRWGRKQTLLRDEVREVRLSHRLSVGQHAGLGLLLGGVTGFLVGSAAACDPHVCGGEGGLAVAGGLVYGTLMGGIGGFVVGEAVHARPGRLVYTLAKP